MLKLPKMINGKTYYQVLGVLGTAEDLVIRAAYRSLSLKYHPDKWLNDPAAANKKMIEINAAYETLGDVTKRKKYDEELEQQNRSEAASDLGEENDDFADLYSEHNTAWDLANTFYPDLTELHQHLSHINAALAYSYKTTLIESKKFEKRAELAEQLEANFLKRYFGEDEDVICLAKVFIAGGRRDAAKYLNQIVKVMGTSVLIKPIYRKITEKYPDVFKTCNLDKVKSLKLTKGLKEAAKHEAFRFGGTYGRSWTEY
jgi:curved DNA-binding protein CbpA